jgi:hypothetical protein
MTRSRRGKITCSKIAQTGKNFLRAKILTLVRIEILAYKTFKKEYEEYLDMLLGGDEFLMKHKIIRDDQFSKYRFSSLIREELARRLEKNLDQLTAEDMQ